MAEGNAITVKIGAETDGIEQGLRQIQGSLKNLESNTKASAEGFGNSFTGMAGAVAVGELAVKAFTGVVNAGFAAARNVVQGFGEALDLGGRLSDLSASTGETAGKLLVLERAFDNSGIGADKVGSSIAKMQKNIEDARDGSGTAASAFAMMGVKVEELEGKLPTEQLKILSSGIQSIDDPTQRAAAAMGVFGKSGAELLPLLTNLDGELSDARDTVGSMAEIMDRRSSVFDAVGDRFKTIGEKVRDFAAGILDKALPAIDAITSALSRIDAAKIGQNLADAFLGGQNAMKGFQASVDAIKTGQISAAFQIFWDSLKLQAAQTANEIYKRLIAAFKTAGDFLGKIFDPSGALISTAISAFEMFGKRVASSIQRDLATTFEALPYGLGESVALALNDMANQSNTAANNIEDNLKGAGGRIAEQFTEAGKALPKSFEENYAKVPPLFDDLSKLQKSIEEQEKAIKKTAEETNAERAKSTEQLEKEKAARAKIAADAKAAAEEEKANAAALVELETAINTAKAAGNEELVKSLESTKQDLESKKEIKKLTEEYQKTLGVNANEAARLANNFVNARNAANDIANRNVIVTVTTKVNRQEYDDLMASINAGTKDPKTLEILFKTTGKTDFDEAYKTLQAMQAINKNFDVALQVSGADSLQEIWQNLNSIPTTKQIQLGMEITGKDTYDEVIRSLPTFAGTKSAKLLLEQQGFENMTSFLNTLKGIPDEKRVKLIAEALGIPDVNAAKAALDQVLINDGKKATVSVGADTSEAEQKIQSVKQSTELPLQFQTMTDISSAMAEIDKIKQTALQPLTLNLEGDASDVSSKVQAFEADPIQFSLEADNTSAAQKINALGATPLSLSLEGDTAPLQKSLSAFTATAQNVDLDAADSIAAIRTALAEPIKMTLDGSGGGGGESNVLTGLVTEIKNLMSELNRKLPAPALA